MNPSTHRNHRAPRTTRPCTAPTTAGCGSAGAAARRGAHQPPGADLAPGGHRGARPRRRPRAVRAGQGGARRGRMASCPSRPAPPRPRVRRAWAEAGVSPIAVMPTRPRSVTSADHVEDDAGLSGVVEVQARPGDEVEEVVDLQAPAELVLQVVGGHEMARPPAGVRNRPSRGSVASVGEELQGEERVRRASLAEVDLDGMGLPRTPWRTTTKSTREATEHALVGEHPADRLGLVRDRRRTPGRPGTGRRGTTWPDGPPRIWSWVERTSSSPSGVTVICTLGLRTSSPTMRSSTMPPASVELAGRCRA